MRSKPALYLSSFWSEEEASRVVTAGAALGAEDLEVLLGAAKVAGNIMCHVDLAREMLVLFPVKEPLALLPPLVLRAEVIALGEVEKAAGCVGATVQAAVVRVEAAIGA